MRKLRPFFFLCLLLLVVSCGQKSPGLQEGAVAPDTTLFDNGMKYLEKNQFIKARLAFQTLINTYPDSEYTRSLFFPLRIPTTGKGELKTSCRQKLSIRISLFSTRHTRWPMMPK